MDSVGRITLAARKGRGKDAAKEVYIAAFPVLRARFFERCKAAHMTGNAVMNRMAEEYLSDLAAGRDRSRGRSEGKDGAAGGVGFAFDGAFHCACASFGEGSSGRELRALRMLGECDAECFHVLVCGEGGDSFEGYEGNPRSGKGCSHEFQDFVSAEGEVHVPFPGQWERCALDDPCFHRRVRASSGDGGVWSAGSFF